MNESLIFGIIIGSVVTIAFWFLAKKKSGSIDNTLIFEKDKEIDVLKEQKKGLEKTEKDLRKSLDDEKDEVQRLLSSINKIDEHKTAITKYTTATELKNKTDAENIGFLKNWAEKLTGSNRYQGDIGEKILEDPYKNCALLQILFTLCKDADIQICQYAMLSLTKAIIDIMPPYKIGTIDANITVKYLNYLNYSRNF